MTQTCVEPPSVQGKVRELPFAGETHLPAWQSLQLEMTQLGHWQLNIDLFLHYSNKPQE